MALLQCNGAISLLFCTLFYFGVNTTFYERGKLYSAHILILLIRYRLQKDDLIANAMK
jgi:hypothetical protein